MVSIVRQRQDLLPQVASFVRNRKRRVLDQQFEFAFGDFALKIRVSCDVEFKATYHVWWIFEETVGKLQGIYSAFVWIGLFGQFCRNDNRTLLFGKALGQIFGIAVLVEVSKLEEFSHLLTILFQSCSRL